MPRLVIPVSGRSLHLGRLFLPCGLLIVILACSMPGLMAGGGGTPSAPAQPSPTIAPPTATPQPQPPALIETNPLPGVELPLDSGITLYFNQAMERASVEAGLSTEPIDFESLSWSDDATLTLRAERSLPPGAEITLSLNSSVRAASGLALPQPISLKFQTVGNLRLAQALPEPDRDDVAPDSAVVAAFNRPVVAIGADPESLPAAIDVTTDGGAKTAAGRGEWINTSTYIFYPEPALEGGKEYSVQLNPDLTGTDGSPLESAAGWSFQTVPPRLLSMAPAGGSTIRLDAKITLTFNQPMDPASVEANFSLLAPGSAPAPGKMAWNEDFTALTFTPGVLLQRATTYTVRVGRQAQASGGTPLGQNLEQRLYTVSPLEVVRSIPEQGGLKDPHAGVSLYFNAPIADKNLLRYITVQPEVSNLSAWWNEFDYSLILSGEFDPADEYTVSLDPDLPDPWGGSLEAPYHLTFRSSPLPPEVFITAGSEIIFLTARDTTIPAQVANMPSLPISLGSITLNDFITMLSPEGYDFRLSYQPSDLRSFTQPLELSPNRSQAVGIQLTADRRPLRPGIYFLKFDLPQQNFFRGPFLLVVSQVHLTFKQSATDALVWAVNLQDHSPVSGEAVSILDENGALLASGQTDAEGIFRATIPPQKDPYRNIYAVVAQPGDGHFGLALPYWSQGLGGWDFGIATDFGGPRLKAYLYTDRPIYRPGQTVYFRAVARQAHNGRYSMPDLGSLPLTLYGDLGQELARFELPLSAYGTGHGEYTLPADAQPGYYRLTSEMVEGSDLSFQVAAYRKPEINLQAHFPSDQALSGRPIQARIEARYFFDAPAGNLPLQWSLYSAPAGFDLPGYQVGVEDSAWLAAFRFPAFGDSLGELIAQGEATTDPQGLASAQFSSEQLKITPDKGRRRLTLEVTGQDESGLPVSARSQVLLNPDEFYIGLRPDAWVGKAGEESGFEVLVVDWNQVPAGVRELRANFQKVEWIREEAAVGLESREFYTGPTFTPKYTPLGSTDFTTNTDGQARIAFTPPEPGTYQVAVSAKNARSEVTLWVGGAGQAAWPNLPNQRLRLTSDRNRYRPGDTAQVFVPNPFGVSSPALVTLERGVVLRHQVLTIDPVGANLSFPLGEEETPNVYVSVTLLGANPQGRPDFRQGYINLSVEPVQQALHVNLTSQPERATPGEEVTFGVQVSDAQGNPVQGEFSLSIVDLAVLALADPNAPDILPAFYGEQPLGVRTGIDLAIYAHRRTILPPGLGGGGGAEAAMVVREKFPDTAYWNAQIETDAAGRAQVSLSLPDSLTTWQIDLRGLTSDTRVGQARIRLVATKDLLIRPVTPRFLVVGDHVQLAAVVQNNTSAEFQVEATLLATGFSLDDPAAATQILSLPADGRARVAWWGKVQDVESVDLVFSVTGGGLQDASRPALGVLPVLHYTAPQTFATAGALDEASVRLELVSLPRSFDPTGGELRLELASSLAGAMLNALDALEHYPYECVEQTLSRFLPNLEVYRAVQQFGVAEPGLEARLAHTLDTGIQRLTLAQNPDGGWGWWPGQQSDPYLTAYALFGLSRAYLSGATVSQEALAKAIGYLQAGLTTPQTLEETWQVDRLAFGYFALVQAGQALQETGAATGYQSGLEALYQERERLNPWAQALLAHSLEAVNPGSSEVQTLLSTLQATAIRSANGAHWEEKNTGWQNMASPISTSAMVLYTLAQLEPGSTMLPEAVRFLMAARAPQGMWESTYSSAWTLMALSEVMKATGELGGDFGYSAALNSIPVASGLAGGTDTLTPVVVSTPLTGLYPDAPNALAIERSSGSGRLYYSLALRVFRPVEQVEAFSKGIAVSRAIYPAGEACEAQACAPIQVGRAGDLVQVRLTLTLEQAAYYLLVEDYLPAGSEVLNARLKTTQLGAILGDGQEPREPLYDSRAPFAAGWGWWLFGEARIYDDHIAWAADFLPAGTYELTYFITLLQPGEYRLLPARAWQFYFPDVQGIGAGSIFEVRP